MFLFHSHKTVNTSKLCPKLNPCHNLWNRWIKLIKPNNIYRSSNWIVLSFPFPFLADRSTTKSKTFDPSWNESFIHEVTNAKNIGLTVFHDAAIPPDDFVANCTIPFEDLAHRDKEQQDFWVSWTVPVPVLVAHHICIRCEIVKSVYSKHDPMVGAAAFAPTFIRVIKCYAQFCLMKLGEIWIK